MGPPWRNSRRVDLLRLVLEESEVEERAREGVEEVRVVEAGLRWVTGNGSEREVRVAERTKDRGTSPTYVPK